MSKTVVIRNDVSYFTIMSITNFTILNWCLKISVVVGEKFYFSQNKKFYFSQNKLTPTLS